MMSLVGMLSFKIVLHKKRNRTSELYVSDWNIPDSDNNVYKRKHPQRSAFLAHQRKSFSFQYYLHSDTLEALAIILT